jgi:hypothetical protein
MKPDNSSHTTFSLLYPSEKPQPAVFQNWGKNTRVDLGLDVLAGAISHERKYESAIKTLLLELCSDTEVIIYRQEILADFINQPEIAEQFAALLPMLARLQGQTAIQLSGRQDPIHQTLSRLTELNTHLECVRQLRAALQTGQAQFQSRGLRELDGMVAQVETDETFQALSQNLPELIARLNGVPSITLGINLDRELRPVEAVLLSINDQPFKADSLLDRLMGRAKKRKDQHAIGPLHSVNFEDNDPLVRLPARVDPLMVPLFRDVFDVLKAVINPITSALRQYAHIQANLLLPLENEIAFYLGAAALIKRLQSHGLPVCRPQVMSLQARAIHLTGMYNLLLAWQRVIENEDGTPIIINDVDFGPDGRIFILTGPNQGGKTVYTQAVGLIQILFQAGLYVPAEQASLSPVDGIYTHFSTEEEFNSRLGRLSEEALRLSEIFKTLTRHSLVLLNESLSSTSPSESFYLSLDIVRALRLYETRAIFATHLHELAADLETINAEGSSDSRVVSLVAGVSLPDETPEPPDQLVTRTFQIKPGPPRGLSYARGIARQFGISFEQLAAQQHNQPDANE